MREGDAAQLLLLVVVVVLVEVPVVPITSIVSSEPHLFLKHV